MKKSVLILGRFQPIHLGHIALIKRYSKAGFFVKIAIGSAQKSYEIHHPLTSKEREEKIFMVMKEFFIKNYKIYHVPDVKNDKSYVEHVRKIVGKFNVVVSGNKHVLSLFLKDKFEKPFGIESFEESLGRPGGNITSGEIRKRWVVKPSKKGLPKSAYNYLKSIKFSDRLNKIKN